MTIPIRYLCRFQISETHLNETINYYHPDRTVIVTMLHAVNAWKIAWSHHVIRAAAAGGCRRSKEVWSWTRRWVDWVTGAAGKSSISPCWVQRACFPLPGICSPSFSSVRLLLYLEFFPIAEMLATDEITLMLRKTAIYCFFCINLLVIFAGLWIRLSD